MRDQGSVEINNQAGIDINLLEFLTDCINAIENFAPEDRQASSFVRHHLYDLGESFSCALAVVFPPADPAGSADIDSNLSRTGSLDLTISELAQASSRHNHRVLVGLSASLFTKLSRRDGLAG